MTKKLIYISLSIIIQITISWNCVVSLNSTLTTTTENKLPINNGTSPKLKLDNGKSKRAGGAAAASLPPTKVPVFKSLRISTKKATTPIPVTEDYRTTLLPPASSTEQIKRKESLPTTIQAETFDTSETTLNSNDNFTPSLIFEPESELEEETEVDPSTKAADEATKFYESQTKNPNVSTDKEEEEENLTGIKLFKDKPINKTEPKIMEITTKITDSVSGKTDIYGPRIEGIEARFEPARHRIPTKLEEKLEALSCDVPPLPSESTLWNGNETRELSLPITIPSDCEPEDLDCPYGMSLSWEGAAEIQTGDVLIVRIDDQTLRQELLPVNISSGISRHRQPEPAVYQVNRSGHDHCDVTDGTLLDITPLVVDGKKLVTLYDKDLTEGVNLLIVVSQQWGKQCVRLKVIVKSDNCGENADCSNKGVCFSNISMEGFECQCCPGYVGPHCEEKDACYPSPCKNNGICVDLSQGHEGSTFQCLCPYGYIGKLCEEETDPCESSPCQNGAKCVGNQTQFRCDCQSGYSGERCQHPLDLCSDSPCKNGICVAQPDGYKCFCRPGFAGENCEYEFNECESSPCLNGGTCMDQIGGYQCLCGRGYNGKRCHIKVDLCDPEPCPEGRICEDRGNNYSCECPKGYSGPQCNIPMKAVCSSNPCHHGGTCWSSVDSFYCACRPGYTGKTCSQEMSLEDIQSSRESERELQDKQEEYVNQNVPMTVRLDKLHNIYIAAGTLACALLIVILTVAACHCRVHETYKRCFLNATPLLPCKIKRLDVLPKHSRTVKPLLEYEKDQMTTPTRTYPTLDTTEVYYTLDFSDSQNAPLIQ